MEDREKRSSYSSDRMDGIRRQRTGASSETTARRAVRSQVPDNRERRARTAARRPGEGAERIRASREDADVRRIQTQRRRPQSEGSQTASGRERAVRRQQTAGEVNRRPASRKAQAKRRRKRNLGLKIALLIILIVTAVASAFLWKRYSPSKERADRKEYYGIEKENQMAVIVDNQVLEPQGMLSDGKAYLQYEIVRDYVNSRFYWDPNENVLLYTLPNDTVSVGVGSKEYTISKEKNSKDYVILKTEGSTAYIALDFVQQYTNIEYEVYDDPNRVMIVSDWGDVTVAEVKKIHRSAVLPE